MQTALEAFSSDNSLDFAVHHAGVALEHLLKAYLCSLHPALVADTSHFPSLLHAVGLGDRSGVLASRTKTIGLKDAFGHVRKLLKPKITVSDTTFEPVFAARNGVAHAGIHDAEEARKVLATCIRIAAPVLVELNIEPEDYWDPYLELVDQLANEHATERRVTFETKIARARRAFHQRFDGLFPEDRARAMATFSAASAILGGDHVEQIDCPACEGRGWLRGFTGLSWHGEADMDNTPPLVVFYPDSFDCAVCGLELQTDELKLAGLPEGQYLDKGHWPS